ncbi:NUMOD1 domain-containing DNA-binding protein [Fodinibius sp.]|uniref:NUMOD1 domain-containing DNA-binding protein n=1 Tax=Fodinibius sp. TaxID=1872440 RepID=UPI002ACEDF40|nr:NUMOD1 domain-containing DNA-binding protein [Fodinibius sp.]MDZ7658520.1 NUMOD1 domain-containing DNA-binding protein [Fodinibius sp.]
MQIDKDKIYSESELRDKNIYGVIYKVENIKTGKIYVGRTTDLKKRIESRRNAVHSERNVSKNGIVHAMRTEGMNCFEYEIIDCLKINPDFKFSHRDIYEEKLNEKEIRWIKKLGAYKDGYNQTTGGEATYDVYTKVLQYDLEGKFIREWDSIKEANLHLNVSDNSVSGIPRVCLGISNVAFGYQWRYKKSEDFPQHIGPVPSDYWVLQYDKEGNFIQKFRTPSIAAEKLDIENGGNKIAECAKNDNYITAYGFQWRYQETDDFPKKIKTAEEQNDLLKHYEEKAKPVIQYDLEGNYINTFRTTDEAAEQTGVFRNIIKRVAEGDYYRAGEYQWRYKKGENIPQQIDSYEKPNTKKVYQYNPESYELVNTWISAREACRQNPDWNYKQISGAVIGKYQKTYLGYVWSYQELTKNEIDEKISSKVKKRSKSKKDSSPGKTVYQYSKDKTKFIKKYESAAEAARQMGYKNGSGISRVARGKRNHYKGYFYSYTKL